MVPNHAERAAAVSGRGGEQGRGIRHAYLSSSLRLAEMACERELALAHDDPGRAKSGQTVTASCQTNAACRHETPIMKSLKSSLQLTPNWIGD